VTFYDHAMAAARQAAVTGRFGRFLLRALSVVNALIGPAAWTGVVFSDEDTGVVVVVATVLTVFGVPFAVHLWRDADRHAVDTERLRVAGVPATAEIVTLAVITHDGHDQADEVKLGLRVSGAGVRPFEAVYLCPHDRSFRVGLRLDAVVDPSDNLFTVPRH